MAADMCAAEAFETRPGPKTQRFGTIVVVGGGCYGSYYVRQLGRAARAGAVSWDLVCVVDRDPMCRVAQELKAGAESPTAGVEVIASDWPHFFDRYLADASERRGATENDAIVPSPLMPHLMFEWL